MNKPPFEVTNKIIEDIAEIAELIGKNNRDRTPWQGSCSAQKKPH